MQAKECISHWRPFNNSFNCQEKEKRRHSQSVQLVQKLGWSSGQIIKSNILSDSFISAIILLFSFYLDSLKVLNFKEPRTQLATVKWCFNHKQPLLLLLINMIWSFSAASLGTRLQQWSGFWTGESSATSPHHRTPPAPSRGSTASGRLQPLKVNKNLTRYSLRLVNRKLLTLRNLIYP